MPEYDLRQQDHCLERRFSNQQPKNELSIIKFKAIGLLEVLKSHNIVQWSVFRLETTRGPRNERIWQKVSPVPRILRRWWNSHDNLDIKDGNTSKVKKNNCWVARISRYNTKHEQVCVERRAINWSMITRIIEGQRWYYPSRIRYISWKSLGCLMMIMIQLSRDFKM